MFSPTRRTGSVCCAHTCAELHECRVFRKSHKSHISCAHGGWVQFNHFFLDARPEKCFYTAGMLREFTVPIPVKTRLVSHGHTQDLARDGDFRLPIGTTGASPTALWNLNDSRPEGPPRSRFPHPGRAWRQLTSRGGCKSSAQHHCTAVDMLTLGEVEDLTIELLPDNVLLEIFKVYVNGATRTEEWHVLVVHVCCRWRNVVFASPRRLDLRPLCTTRTPVRARLVIWPPFPIAITGRVDRTSLVAVTGNIVAALEHKDRVCHIDLKEIPNSLFGRNRSSARANHFRH